MELTRRGLLGLILGGAVASQVKAQGPTRIVPAEPPGDVVVLYLTEADIQRLDISLECTDVSDGYSLPSLVPTRSYFDLETVREDCTLVAPLQHVSVAVGGRTFVGIVQQYDVHTRLECVTAHRLRGEILQYV